MHFWHSTISLKPCQIPLNTAFFSAFFSNNNVFPSWGCWPIIDLAYIYTDIRLTKAKDNSKKIIPVFAANPFFVIPVASLLGDAANPLLSLCYLKRCLSSMIRYKKDLCVLFLGHQHWLRLWWKVRQFDLAVILSNAIIAFFVHTVLIPRLKKQ